MLLVLIMANLAKNIVYGILGGITSGILMVMGALIMGISQMYTDWLPSMLGIAPSANNLIIGLALQMMGSVIVGAVFGFFLFIWVEQFGKEEPTLVTSLGFGLIYGVVFLLIATGELIFIIPAVFEEIMTDLTKLFFWSVGHIMEGLIIGLVFIILFKRS